MPAAGRFKAQQAAAGEFLAALRFPSLRVKTDSVFCEGLLHFAEGGFTLVPKASADFLRGGPQQHGKHRLSALKVGGFVNVFDVHFRSKTKGAVILVAAPDFTFVDYSAGLLSGIASTLVDFALAKSSSTFAESIFVQRETTTTNTIAITNAGARE